MIPGDIYEIRAVVAHNDAAYSGSFGNNNLFNQAGFVNLDINLASGENKVYSFSGSGVQKADLGDRAQTISTPVFSTFSNAVKWNTLGDHTGSSDPKRVITSNFFSMPQLPEANEGFHIQIGPGNSDHLFSADNQLIKHDFNTNWPTAYQGYWADLENNSSLQSAVGASQYNTVRPGASAPANFGVGLPWYQMRHLYSELMPFIDANENGNQYKFWWDDIATPTWDNMPTLADAGVELEAVELIRYSKNPYMLQSVDVYKINGEYTGDGSSALNKISSTDLEYGHFAQAIIDNKNYGTSDPVEYTNRKRNVYVLSKIRNLPVDPTEGNAPAITAGLLDSVPTIHLAYDTLINDSLIYGWVRTNTGGLLLSEITNHLGGVTQIEYYELNEVETSLMPRYTNPWVCNGAVSKPVSHQQEQIALQIACAVKTVKVQSESGWQETDYAYDLPEIHDNTIYLSSDHFTQRSASVERGFGSTKVTLPVINGVRPYTVTKHYTNEVGHDHFWGKVKRVTQHGHNGVMLSKDTNEYAVTKAYENAAFRPDFRQYKYHYPYQDYRLNLTQHLTPKELKLYRPPTFDLPFTMAQGENPKFYETSLFLNSTDHRHNDSWFVKLMRTTHTEYEEGCTVNFAAGYQNNQGNGSGEVFGIIANGEGEEAAMESALLAASPLPDTVLLHLFNTGVPLSNNLIKTVLLVQPDLSDAVIQAMLDRSPAVGETTIRQILTNLDADRSPNILSQLLNRTVSGADVTFRDVVLAQDSVADSLWVSLINRSPAFADEHLFTILSYRQQLSESVLTTLINRTSPMPEQDLVSVLGSQQPAVNDVVLQSLINRTTALTDTVLEAALVGTPYALSSATITAMQNRTPALSSSIENNIINAQSGQVDYASWLQGWTGNQQGTAYYNFTGNDAASLYTALQGPEESSIKISLVAGSPLSDGVLIGAIDRTPIMSGTVLEEIFLAQPDLSDGVLINFLQRDSLNDDIVFPVLKSVPHLLTDSVIMAVLNRQPLMKPAKLQQILLAQVQLSETAQLRLLDQTLNVPNSMIEAVLLKQVSLTDSVLIRSLKHQPPLNDAALVQLVNKQPGAASDAVLNAVVNQSYLSNSASQAILVAYTDTFSVAVSDWIDQRSPGYPSDVKSAIERAQEGRKPNAFTMMTYCGYPTMTTTLEMTTITENEYYEANEEGITTSNGFREIMDLNAPSIQLRHEPSWQLYRTRSYSPQHPGGQGEEEYFYYWDLMNRYDRDWLYFPQNTTEYVPNSNATFASFYDIDSITYSNAPGATCVIDTTWLNNGDYVVNFEGCVTTVHYNPMPKTIDYEEILQTASPNDPYEGPRVEGMVKSHEYGIRPLVFQQRTTSKVPGNPEALQTSAYFLYDTRWNESIDPEKESILLTGLPCDSSTVVGLDSLEQSGCWQYKEVDPGFYAQDVPWGHVLYAIAGNPETEYWICPFGQVNGNDPGITILYSNPSQLNDYTIAGDTLAPLPLDTTTSGPSEQVTFGGTMNRYLMHRATVVQVDTLDMAQSIESNDDRASMLFDDENDLLQWY